MTRGGGATLNEGKKVNSQDSPVPWKLSDMTGAQEVRAPNTAWSVSWMMVRTGLSTWG